MVVTVTTREFVLQGSDSLDGPWRTSTIVPPPEVPDDLLDEEDNRWRSVQALQAQPDRERGLCQRPPRRLRVAAHEEWRPNQERLAEEAAEALLDHVTELPGRKDLECNLLSSCISFSWRFLKIIKLLIILGTVF